MEDDYKFSTSGKYFAPPEGPLKDSRAYCKQLPLLDEPETFGLHDNAAITFQQKETKGMLDTIIALEGSGGGWAGGTDSEALVTDLCAELLGKLPSEPFSMKRAHPSTFAKIDDGT